MKIIRSNKWFIPISVIVIVVLGVIVLQTYARCTLQARIRDASGYLVSGRLRSATDDIGDQFSPGNTSIQKSTTNAGYEPYYLQGSYEKQRSNTVPGGGPTAIPSMRKLIQRSELSLEVKSSRDTAAKIAAITTTAGGYILDSQIQKSGGDAQSGRAVLKIPPAGFGDLMEKIKALGKVDLESLTGEDVTEEYVDLTARLNNYKIVRDRLVKILEVNSNNVHDILEVEREIARVGGEMERIEGRMKFLDTQVALATVTVNFYETRPIAPGAFNVINRFKQTLRDAADVFINVFNGFIILLAAIVPIVLWIGIGCAIFIAVRKFLRRG